jgi:putative ABC transport system substrate-binding protein
MKRRHFLASIGLGALALRASAQGRVPKIGYLVLSPLTEPPSRERQAFLDGLRALGYLPGKNVEIVYGSAEGDEEFLDDVCKELIGREVDVIAVSGEAPVLAAKRNTRTVPIVMQAVGDPVGIGAVRSLARPEGNLTGLSFLSSELAGKRMQLLREVVPSIRRVAVLWDTRNSYALLEAQASIAAAKRLEMVADAVPVNSDSQLPGALEKAFASRAQALHVTFDGGLVARNRSFIAQAALKQRIPTVSGWSFFTEAGGLVSYAPDIPEVFRRSASYVDRILKGAKPSELPVEQATTVELVLNANTARALGLQIPQSILLRADRVIE